MSRFITCILLSAVALCATTAMAGPLNGFGSAIPGFTGSTHFQGYSDHPFDTKMTKLTGDIDYAVFAPGDFPTGLGQFVGYTPTPGEYVYAYQAYETGAAPLSNVSIDLEAFADNIGTFSGLGVSGQFPIPLTGSYFFPDDVTPESANWDFSPAVKISLGNPAGSTSGLVFSSPYGPKLLAGGTIDDGSTAVVIPLPSPDPAYIPEPSTLTLAACGLIVFGLQWLRRRGHKIVS